MTQAEEWANITPILLIVTIAIFGVAVYLLYRKNKSALLTHENAVIVAPSKLRFLRSWYIYFLAGLILIPLLLWKINAPGDVFWVSSLLLPILWLFSAISTHPYYPLSIYDNKLAGATVGGLGWKRTEISFSDIDKGRINRHSLLSKLGIVLFHSMNGETILALGLDESQVSQVLAMISIATKDE